MNNIAFALLGAMLMAGCGEKVPETQAAAAPEAPKVEHNYSLKDGIEYGYEQAVSQDQQNAGHVASTLMMFKYAGAKNGIHQTYMTSEAGAVTVAECANPCEFIKVMVFVGGQHASTERMRAKDGSIGALVMDDAINGQLEQGFEEENGQKFTLWFDEKDGVKITQANTPS